MLIIHQFKNGHSLPLSSIEDTDSLPEADKVNKRFKRNLDVVESIKRQRWAMNRSGKLPMKKLRDFRNGDSLKSMRPTKNQNHMENLNLRS